MIIDPAGMTAVEWTGRMAEILPGLAAMKIDEDEQWREWALNAIQAVDLQSPVGGLDPFMFDAWRQWADAFNQILYGVLL